MVAIPREQRERAAGDAERLVGQHAEQLAQRHGRDARVGLAREARLAVELAEVDRVTGRPARHLAAVDVQRLSRERIDILPSLVVVVIPGVNVTPGTVVAKSPAAAARTTPSPPPLQPEKN